MSCTPHRTTALTFEEDARIIERAISIEDAVRDELQRLGALAPEGERLAGAAVYAWLTLLEIVGMGAEVTPEATRLLAAWPAHGDREALFESLGVGIELGLFVVRDGALHTSLPGPAFLPALPSG